jgi:hypothetical protein
VQQQQVRMQAGLADATHPLDAQLLDCLRVGGVAQHGAQRQPEVRQWACGQAGAVKPGTSSSTAHAPLQCSVVTASNGPLSCAHTRRSSHPPSFSCAVSASRRASLSAFSQ